MKKAYLMIGLLTSLCVIGLFTPPLVGNPHANFLVSGVGNPDQYGNQILNVTLEQNTGGSWVTRGIVTNLNYTGSNSIVGLLNQSVRFTTVSALNYSWVGNSTLIPERTSMLLSLTDIYDNEPMTLESYELITEDQGWIVTHSYIWDEEGYPEISAYGVTFDFYATGVSQNYNLTLNDWLFDSGDWSEESGGDPGQYVNQTFTGLNITGVVSGTDQYFILRRTATSPATTADEFKIRFRTSGTSQLWVRLTLDGDYHNVVDQAAVNWTTLTMPLPAGGPLTITELILNSSASGIQRVEIAFITIVSYGAYNKTVTEVDAGDDGDFLDSNSQYSTEYRGYWQTSTANVHFTQTGFSPLHNLPNVSIVLWVVPSELGNDYVYVGQYVDATHLIELGLNNGSVVGDQGNFTFTVGNGTHAIEARTPITIDTYYLFCVIATWSSGDYATITVFDPRTDIGTTNQSATTLNGVIDADDELFIGPRDGVGVTNYAFYGLSLYYKPLTSGERNGIYAVGPDQTVDPIFHHWGFNEINIGYGVNDHVLNAGLFTKALRESWGLIFISTDLTGFLFPWPINYPTEWVFVIAVCLLCIVPTILIWLIKEQYSWKNIESWIGFTVMAVAVIFMLILIVLTGAGG